MKKILLILLFCSRIWAQETGNIAEHEKEKFLKTFSQKEINYPGDPSYDVIYYKLTLDISYSPQYLIGEVTISAESTIDGLYSLFLDLSDVLTVDSVKSLNQNLQFTHTQDILTIQPEHPYNLNEEFIITVFYQGIPQTTGLGSFVFDSHNGQPSIWSLSEPYGARDWCPCKDTPSDKADSSDVWVTCNSGLFCCFKRKISETMET